MKWTSREIERAGVDAHVRTLPRRYRCKLGEADIVADTEANPCEV